MQTRVSQAECLKAVVRCGLEVRWKSCSISFLLSCSVWVKGVWTRSRISCAEDMRFLSSFSLAANWLDFIIFIFQVSLCILLT